MARDSDTSSKAKPGGTVKLTAATPKAKSAPKAAPTTAPRPTIVGAAVPMAEATLVKKPEFLDRALARTDVKRRDAKPAIEAAMAELAAILLAGDEVNIPPLGKIKVVKAKDVGEGAQVLTLKMRTMKDGAGQGAGHPHAADKTGVADAGDDG